MMWTGISVVIKFDKGKKKSGYELFFFVVYVKLIIVFSGNFFILSSSLEWHAEKQHALETRKQENNFSGITAIIKLPPYSRSVSLALFMMGY